MRPDLVARRMKSKAEIDSIADGELEILAHERDYKTHETLQKIKQIDEELLKMSVKGRCPRHMIHRRNTLLKRKDTLNDELVVLTSRAGEDYVKDARHRSLNCLEKLAEEVEDGSKEPYAFFTETTQSNNDVHLGSCAKRRNKRKANVRVYSDAFESGELVVDQFKSSVGDFTVPATVDHSDVCGYCAGKLMLDTQSRRLVCIKCCTEAPSNYVFVQSNQSQKNGYQRVVYFIELIRSETGVSCPLTDKQLTTIKQKINNKKITTESVDEACKLLGWNKLARFRTGIVERLTGKKSPLKYTPAQQREVVDKFHIVNQSFDRLKSNGSITERVNFPYAFFHFKLVESTSWGRPFLPLFRLPDSRPLLKHQAIWKKVCKDCRKNGFDIPFINTI